MDPNHMKQQEYQHCSKHSFVKDDHFFLFLQPYKQTSLKVKGHQELTPNFYDPYHIVQCIGQVAYKLVLPSHSKIHTVFHVPCLMKAVNQNCQVQTIAKLDEEGSIWIQSKAILATRECQLHQWPLRSCRTNPIMFDEIINDRSYN